MYVVVAVMSLFVVGTCVCVCVMSQFSPHVHSVFTVVVWLIAIVVMGVNVYFIIDQVVSDKLMLLTAARQWPKGHGLHDNFSRANFCCLFLMCRLEHTIPFSSQ